jgi:hypothetical protein
MVAGSALLAARDGINFVFRFFANFVRKNFVFRKSSSFYEIFMKLIQCWEEEKIDNFSVHGTIKSFIFPNGAQ